MTQGLPRRRTVPTELAALAVGVEESTIRKWASRGRLTRYGRPRSAEYDLDELARLAGDTESRGTGTPQAARPPTQQNRRNSWPRHGDRKPSY